MEQVRAVPVHLNAGPRLGLAVGVAADVGAALDHQHPEPEVARAALGHGQPEEARPDHDEVDIHWFTLSGRFWMSAANRSGLRRSSEYSEAGCAGCRDGTAPCAARRETTPTKGR